MEHNISYLNCNQKPYQFRDMYSLQDTQVPQSFHYPQVTKQSLAFDLSTLHNPYINGLVQYVYQ